MPELVLQCGGESDRSPCTLCGKPVQGPPGCRMRTIENLDPVCLDCGARHAPALAALVRLAQTAQRVARMGRHCVFPPLSALLDLASTAESYTAALQPAQRKAG